MNSAVISVAQRFENARSEMSLARAEYIAALPYATAEQAAAVVFCAREVTLNEVALQDKVTLAAGLNREFRLTEEQADQLAAARAEHKVLINTAPVKAEAVRMVSDSRLRSYKLRLRKDGRTVVNVSGVL